MKSSCKTAITEAGQQRILAWFLRRRRVEVTVMALGAMGLACLGALTGFLIYLAFYVGCFFVHIGYRTAPYVAGAALLIICFDFLLGIRRDPERNQRALNRLSLRPVAPGTRLGRTSTLIAQVLEICPWLLNEAWAVSQRCRLYLRTDAEACTLVLCRLASRPGRVSFRELSSIIAGHDPFRVFPMLKEMGGIVLLFKEPQGLSLTAELRAELRELLGERFPEHEPEERAEILETPADALDSWQILGVPCGASLEDVKTAYRKAIKLCHPDRFATMGGEIAKLAEERTKILNAAYEELQKLAGCS